MRHIHTAIHIEFEDKKILKRKATRAIALIGEMILLLYTERYHDYSLPGGGLDEGEDLVLGMKRELEEETGAMNIRDVREYGIYEEYRPWTRANFDVMHMVSYCYTCKVNEALGVSKLENYERDNGMKAVWINIDEAISHNEETMISSEKKGMSIMRETFLLKLIKRELI